MPHTATKMQPVAPVKTVATTKIVKFMTDQVVPPAQGMSTGPYVEATGYRQLNLTVKWDQELPSEAPVGVNILFAYDAAGTMCSNSYINCTQATQPGQPTSKLIISGAGDNWHGSPHNISTYMVRVPVMAPYVQVFADNFTDKPHKITIWAYLES